MRLLTLLALGFLALALLPTDLAAQQRRGPAGVAAPTDSVIASYKVRLNLTDEQTAEIRTILETQVEKARAVVGEAREQGRETMGELRPKMEQMRGEANEQIEEILTEEQIPEYRKIQAEIQAEIQEERQRRMRQRQPGG